MNGKNQLENRKRFSGFSMVSALCLVLTASVWAQGPRGGGPGMGPGPGLHLDGMMGEYLQVTDSQKAQAKSLSEAAQAAAKPIQQQLRQLQNELQTAIHSGQEDSALQSLATQQGVLMGQLIGIRAKNQAQIYALLTPAQQQKLNQYMEKQKSQRQSRRNQDQQGTTPDAGAGQ